MKCSRDVTFLHICSDKMSARKTTTSSSLSSSSSHVKLGFSYKGSDRAVLFTYCIAEAQRSGNSMALFSV